MDRKHLLIKTLSTQGSIMALSNTGQLAVLQGGSAILQAEKEQADAETTSHTTHGGSQKGRSGNLHRHFEAGYERLHKDYFAENAVYSDYYFRRRFRMHRDLYLKIVHDVTEHDRYFAQKCDATGKPGLHPLQKITSAMRILAYGNAGDTCDEYLRIGESTSHKSLDHFCQAIINLYSTEYLRSPNEADVRRLLSVGKDRGFPGMLGSIDCMHWEWKNCPTGWAGQFQGKEKVPTIVLEAVVSQDLWFWHAFFGMPGSHNDKNVLDASPLFQNLLNDETPPCEYKINGNTYNHGYYLADGIYPDWSTLIKTISQPQGLQRKYFAKMQESCRKDVERAFGVLQARFAVVARPALGWNHRKLQIIMRACIILHNMIVENERSDPHDYIYDSASRSQLTLPAAERLRDLSIFIRNYWNMRNSEHHYALRDDLIAHLWVRKGQMETESSEEVDLPSSD